MHRLAQRRVRRSKIEVDQRVLSGERLPFENSTLDCVVSTFTLLLCPVWKKYGTVRTVKAGPVILHSQADDVVPFGDSKELVGNSGLPASAVVEVGTDHRLAEPEPLKAMLRACEGSFLRRGHGRNRKE